MADDRPVIVYVHGISRHDPGYSEPWRASLIPHLDQDVQACEVLWSDLVNAASMRMMADGPPQDEELKREQAFRLQLEVELEARSLKSKQAFQVAATSGDEQAMAMGGVFGLDDFVRYMCWRATREAILDRFHQVIHPLLETGHQVHIVSHSWGTVVTYEGLRSLDGMDLPGRVNNFFTLGSALSLRTVRGNLLDRLQRFTLPERVDTWINVDAAGDIVGGKLRPTMPVTREYLDQHPTGCKTRRRWWWPIATDPLCAHSSYLRAENEKVNKTILAHYINKTL